MEPDMVADSMTDALAQLAEAGYTVDFTPRSGEIHCGRCHDVHRADQALVDHIYRYEGPSDPDEEAIALALSCPVCGAKGTLVSGYGPSTDPDAIELIVSLTDDRR
jgi:hypothetical protein